MKLRALHLALTAAVILPLLMVPSGAASEPTANDSPSSDPALLLPPIPSTITVTLTPQPLRDGFFCPGFNSLQSSNPTSEIMQGRVSIKDLGIYQAGLPEAPYDINWLTDPYKNSTWRNWFLTLKWLGTPLNEIGAVSSNLTDQQKQERLKFVLQVVADLLIDNPNITSAASRTPEFGSMAHRTQFLACLAELAPDLIWLQQALMEHSQHLILNDKGDWNQGLDQHLALLSVGQALKDDALIQEAKFRLDRDAETAFDIQGVSNEQSISYGLYAHRRWLVASNRLSRLGISLPESIQKAMKETPLWLAHATQPDGTLVPLGESFVSSAGDLGAEGLEFATSLGTKGVAPTDRFKIYSAGYVFGRSSWTDFKSQSYYTLRYGPRIDYHGQRDHTSITWWGAGMQILIDSGHPGYVDVVRRKQLSAIDAHNVLRPISKELTPERTVLVNHLSGENFESYTLRSNSEQTKKAPQITRIRSALFHHEMNFVIVADKGRSSIPTTWQQRWIFAPQFNGVINTDGSVTNLIQPRITPVPAVSLTPTKVVRSTREVIFKEGLSIAPVVDLVSQKRNTVLMITLISYGKEIQITTVATNTWEIMTNGKTVRVYWELATDALRVI